MKIYLTNKPYLHRGSARTVLVLIMVVIVLSIGVIGMMVLKKTGPKADREAPAKSIPTVKVITPQLCDIQLYVNTQGEVKARMSTQLSSQVMGRTTMVSPKLKAGGVFEKGEVMLEIERVDFITAVARAESALADARLLLEQEQARAEQALRDWKKLGKGDAPDLVARKPQILSAKAKVRAAEAEVGRCARDLERTTLRAPYHCRVDESYVDYGAHIIAGMRVADVSSMGVRELRVPVPLKEMAYLKDEELIGSAVSVEAEFAGEIKMWRGRVSLSEGKVDRRTMMMHLIVEITGLNDNSATAQPPTGLFAQAVIKGRIMKQVMEIPRSALRDNQTVLTVNEEGQLQVLSVTVARTMKDTVLISRGIPVGSVVITSAIATPVRGMQLEIEAISNEQD